jgi:orotidine-5'-phosphate decarboxylase
MNKNIFVACDVSSQKEILDLLSKIHKEISGIKIGLQYITKHSLEKNLVNLTNLYFMMENFLILKIH